MSNTASVVKSRALSSEKVVSVVVAMLLGSVLLSVVAFAGSATIHNAAHDVRHSMTFPCH